MKSTFIFSIAITTLLFTLFACSDSPTGSKDDSAKVDAQFQSSQEALKAMDNFLGVSTMTYSIAQFVPGLSKIAAPADTLLPGLLTCPYVLWDAGSNTLTLDFGDGCEDAHGQMHSGSIEISYTGSLDSSATLSITFNDYMMDDEALSGSLTLNVTPDSIRFTIQDATISSPEGTFIVNADLTVNVELNNPVVVTDDVFFLSGTFSVVDAEAGANFALEITDPVRIQTNCPYPTSGKVAVSGGDSSGTFAATADFFPENGACDNVVAITIGTATRKVQL